ncbi:MAG: hypothetical protein ACI976_000415, partial [Aureispira sp.]
VLEELYLEGNYFRAEEKEAIIDLLPNTNIYFDLD